MRVGCDIVQIKRFENMDKEALDKIFHKQELKNKTETLAGFFAAKEACKKVFNDLHWHDIEITRGKTGRPSLVLKKQIKNYDISISHDGDYAMAIFVCDEVE